MNITDKRGYAQRWLFSPRHVDNLIARGLPHLKIGKRRVRILIDEADSWMRETYGTQYRKLCARVWHTAGTTEDISSR